MFPCKIACQAEASALSVLQDALALHFLMAWNEGRCQNRLHGKGAPSLTQGVGQAEGWRLRTCGGSGCQRGEEGVLCVRGAPASLSSHFGREECKFGGGEIPWTRWGGQIGKSPRQK